MRLPEEANLWLVDNHAYQARVHGKSLAYNIRLAKPFRSSSGAWHPTHSADGMTAAQMTSAADRPWTCPHSPFRVSRTSHIPSRAGSVPASPIWQHVDRSVLRELDIEFEPSRRWTRQFLQLSWKLAATCTRHTPSEADTARESKLLQLRVIYLCDRFEISQDRTLSLEETAVRIVPSAESAYVFSSRAFVTVTLAANMMGGMWTQIVYEGKSDRVHPHGPAFPCQLVSHSPTHWNS